MERTTLFVDVILPLALPNLYTYRVPYEWNDSVAIGKRVVVQFGKNKLYTALIRKTHSVVPRYETKYIVNILDDEAIVNTKQFELWEWMAEYYMCTIGDIMNAALPGGLKLSSETKIILNSEYSDNKEIINALPDKEYLLIEALENANILSISEIQQIIDQKQVYPIIKSLIEKKLIVAEEEIKEKYKPKIEQFIALTDYADSEETLKVIFTKLEKKAFKQLELLIEYIKLSDRYRNKKRFIKKSELLKNAEATSNIVNQLIKKNIFKIQEEEVGRLDYSSKSNYTVILNEYQQQAFESIQEQFKTKEVALLHGVTSSGKTEIYIQLIQKIINEGKQVLYLLPEIALTTQIINRLKKHFGNKVGVYHSRLNENERVEVWKEISEFRIQNSEFNIILGARSALFLPFDNLGLIIVDEEHDNSYKQQDPAPRYNARDSAVFLGGIHQAKILLGSATPSLESYYNALNKKYGKTELNKRFADVQMPEIILSDIKEASRKKLMKSHFSPALLDNMEIALQNKEQIILFQNRRGFVPIIECGSCAWVPQCKNCDVSMTYHKTVGQLRCHYCGYSSPLPQICPACGDVNLNSSGFGTEKIEEEINIFFPKAKVARMDLDSTRTKHAYQNLISAFENREIDILVGTQMVTKGLDFDNVTLVGILNADSMLSYPNFRAQEKSFQIMTQVSGRAGRKSKRGKVVIQTYNVNHAIIQYVLNNNYLSFYNSQIEERKNFNYPPFYRLIEITLKHKDMNLLDQAAFDFGKQLKKDLGNRVLGPEYPPIARIRNLYNKKFLLKIEKAASLNKLRELIKASVLNLRLAKEYKNVLIVLDVDPV